ncbi:MAG: hypothetical protein AAF702_10000 [Chloroflexota bacterium]
MASSDYTISSVPNLWSWSGWRLGIVIMTTISLLLGFLATNSYALMQGVKTAPSASSHLTTHALESLDVTDLSFVPTQSITVGNILSGTDSLIEEDAAVVDDSAEGDDVSDEAPTVSPPILEGTIIANRTEAAVTFFAEGELRRLEPLRSTGIALPRESFAINLFNCDADDESQSDEDCFWDPYLVQADGFYEILNGAEEGLPLKLILEEAGVPDTDQIRIQNRTTSTEIFFFGETPYELPPTAFSEFEAPIDDTPALFYLRSCLSLNDESVCEWLPQPAAAGQYYALNETRSSIGLPNSQLTYVELTPILAQVDSASETIAIDQSNVDSSTESQAVAPGAVDGVTQSATSIPCRLIVPTLNIRSGPGLEYLIISQAFTSETDEASVRVIGQDASGFWLATDERIIAGGWIASAPNLLTCDGDLVRLPIVPITDGRLAPVPEPAELADSAPDAESDSEGAAGENADEEDTGGENNEGEDGEPTPPKGQSLLILENVFEADVRFTLNEEYDLQPGDTVNIVVNAGRVQFSVSSPWKGGMAGNAEFTIEPDQTRKMFLYFIPDPENSDRWLMRYE